MFAGQIALPPETGPPKRVASFFTRLLFDPGRFEGCSCLVAQGAVWSYRAVVSPPSAQVSLASSGESNQCWFRHSVSLFRPAFLTGVCLFLMSRTTEGRRFRSVLKSFETPSSPCRIGLPSLPPVSEATRYAHLQRRQLAILVSVHGGGRGLIATRRAEVLHADPPLSPRTLHR